MALPIHLFKTVAVGCIALPQCTASQTDRHTDRGQYHANGRSHCVHYDRLKGHHDVNG